MADILMQVPLGTGDDVVVVEVDPLDISDELVLASSLPYQVAAKATKTLEQLLDTTRPTLQAISAWMRSVNPDECCVEFGLKLGGETGVVVARGTAEVNFVVRMTWKNTGAAQQP